MLLSQIRTNSVDMRNVRKDALFFTSAPPLNELCTVCITVPSQPMKGGSVNTFQPQVIKCRELIFTEPDIIASPMLGGSGKVQIVMKIDLFKTGRLQARFQRMKVEVDKPKRVTPTDYQSCLKYTLLARLAPLWNKVGNYLIQGREFVVSTQKMNAITMELTSNDSQLYLQLKSHSIRIPPVCLKDLIISSPVVDEFLTNLDSCIQDFSIDNRWCHVLPSMKKGQIVKIVHQIPSDCPFNSYKDVKKYWKNMYGYRLPETEEGLLYYQIYFKPIGHTLFTYPECCVRLKDIASFGCTNQMEVLQQLLTNIHAKMPILCGSKIKFESQASYTVPKLIGAWQDTSEKEDPNLTQKTSNSQCTRSKNEKRANPYIPWIPSGLQSATTSMNRNNINNQMKHIGGDGNLVNSSNDLNDLIFKRENSDIDMKDQNVGHMDKSSNSQANSNTMQNEPPDSSSGLKPKLVPVFRSKLAGTGSFRNNVGSRNYGEKKIIPMFKSTQTKQNPKVVQHISGNDMFADLKKLKEKLGESFSSANDSNNLPSQPVSIYCSKDRLGASFSQQNDNKQIFTKHIPEINMHIVGKNALKTKSFVNCSSNNRSLLNSPNIVRAEISGSTPMKRKLVEENIDGENKVKKPRSKPKIQEHLDIVSLAKVNQLGKVNSHTLVSWLKSKDIPCRSKDKKADLIDKVGQYLQLNISEQ